MYTAIPLATVLLLVQAVTSVEYRLLVLTVATSETDGHLRMVRSLKQFQLDYRVLGLGTPWTGGDVRFSAGGGQKVRLLREALQEHKKDENLIVLFVDSYDVIVNADAEEILRRFYKQEAKILFSAEGFCWPDSTLATKYPIVKFGKRYLNSGAFIGYAPQLYKMIIHQPIDDGEDDQLFYTLLYLDEHLREELDIKLDSTSELFQNLNGATDDVSIDFSIRDKSLQLLNNAYGTSPIIVHGNGNSKVVLNSIGNYLGNWWNLKDDCVACKENRTSLKKPEDNWPVVLMALFVTKPTPFIDFYFEYLQKLDYPKSRMSLFIYSQEKFHEKNVSDFASSAGDLYQSVTIVTNASAEERTARSQAIEYCLEKNCDYLFSVDSEVHLENAETLRLLIEANKPFIAPLVARVGKLWTNYWGAVTQDGFYARSLDYTAITSMERRGIWNVPYVSNVYLISNSRLVELKNAYSYAPGVDSDMGFCQYCRDSGYFMFVDNQQHYGHLINPEDFDISVIHPDLYNMFQNKFDWERKYLHENYSEVLKPGYQFALPCPDVYWFPLFSKKFCRDMVDIMEHYGKWSSGKHEDNRLVGGYENVPTVDIHMNQVGFERHWLHLLDTYVRPVQEITFLGYYKRPPEATMNFVVRYHPNEQPYLRPHHDASTYTVDMALNQVGVDYEGGGVRYVRYNCSVIDTIPGWSVIHPGRLTHLHEGLPTKKGARYILVSFVDP